MPGLCRKAALATQAGDSRAAGQFRLLCCSVAQLNTRHNNTDTPANCVTPASSPSSPRPPHPPHPGPFTLLTPSPSPSSPRPLHPPHPGLSPFLPSLPRPLILLAPPRPSSGLARLPVAGAPRRARAGGGHPISLSGCLSGVIHL